METILVEVAAASDSQTVQLEHHPIPVQSSFQVQGSHHSSAECSDDLISTLVEAAASSSTPVVQSQGQSPAVNLATSFQSPVQPSTSGHSSEAQTSEESSSLSRPADDIAVAPGGLALPAGHNNEPRFLNMDELIAIWFGNPEVVQKVPNGKKEDVYFVVNNEYNIMRRKRGKHSEFTDDCGAWNGGPSNKIYFQIEQNGEKYSKVVIKNDLYCLERRNKKTCYFPVQPQPTVDNILTVHRAYNTSKSSDFERRITWIEHEGEEELPMIACYEYRGTFPTERKPHGNSKRPSAKAYKRVPKQVLANIRTELKTKKPAEAFKSLLENGDQTLTPRDVKQVRNIQYLEKKKAKVGRPGPMMDQSMLFRLVPVNASDISTT